MCLFFLLIQWLLSQEQFCEFSLNKSCKHIWDLAAEAGSKYPLIKPLFCRILALPTNIKLGWKGLPGMNTLATLVSLLVMKKKVF